MFIGYRKARRSGLAQKDFLAKNWSLTPSKCEPCTVAGGFAGPRGTHYNGFAAPTLSLTEQVLRTSFCGVGSRSPGKWLAKLGCCLESSSLRFWQFSMAGISCSSFVFLFVGALILALSVVTLGIGLIRVSQAA